MAQPDIMPQFTQPEGDSSERVSAQDSSATPLAFVSNDPTSREARFSKLSLLVIAILAIAILWTGQTLRNEIVKNAALEADVAALESELVRAEASVSAHEERIEIVRAEVGDLLLRTSALNNLVARDVVPEETVPEETVPEDTLRVPLASPRDVGPAPVD